MAGIYIHIPFCKKACTYCDFHFTTSTKYVKEIENEVHNFLGKSRDGFYLYSVTRLDGFNSQERAKNKAEKLVGYAANAEKRSDQYYEASQEGRDFLALGEPIKGDTES